MKAYDANVVISFLLSVDVIIIICIYFVPTEDWRRCKLGSVEQIWLDAAKELKDCEKMMELLSTAKTELKDMESKRNIASLEFGCPSCSCPSCKRRISSRDGSLQSLPLVKEDSEGDNDMCHCDEQDSTEE